MAAPVDEMVHALTAQFTVLSRVQADLSVTFVHSTDNERFGYDRGLHRPGAPGSRLGRAAPPVLATEDGDGAPSVLFEHYESIGVQAGGRLHFFTFGR
ncbi:hypothetical protein [Frankia sp. AgB32]|uniref:hypothetical protein n=1 Tax=Frankia sp. AgB32 TaxID=631119 RepID=UPI0020100EA5|nr:hypothetical protein [Frankia sp. AgB32]MCK9897717.1 hypothetical protein [Frankia sp. AgB32]